MGSLMLRSQFQRAHHPEFEMQGPFGTPWETLCPFAQYSHEISKADRRDTRSGFLEEHGQAAAMSSLDKWRVVVRLKLNETKGVTAMNKLTVLFILLSAAMLFTASQAFAATSSGQNMASGYYQGTQYIHTPTICTVQYGPAEHYPYNTNPANPNLLIGTPGYSYPYNGKLTSTCGGVKTVPNYPKAQGPGAAQWEPSY
jgi:hypothetical protein